MASENRGIIEGGDRCEGTRRKGEVKKKGREQDLGKKKKGGGGGGGWGGGGVILNC